jgi:Glycoside hydrolase family 44
MRSAGLGVAAVLLVVGLSPASAQNAAVTVNVDATANRHPIDPRVYGLAWATSTALGDLNCPVNRQGGNTASRHNWSVNASNRGFDWFFESIADGPATPGEMGDTFITDSRAGGAQPMLTIPMIGWVAKLAANRDKLASFSIAKYGAQQGNDWQWFPDAGNGVLTNGSFVNNDKNDANVPADSAFQLGWVQHLVNRWGSSATGGLRYYLLDNEHSIWHSTHRDVHPVGAMMEEIRDKTLQYSNMIKGADPSALVLGPEEWGWSGYFLSGYDQQWGGVHGWSNLPDKTAHGNMDYLPWLLDQLRQRESAGQRALDVFTVHYYPQGGEFGDDTSSAMQLRRNRSTRSLWDPSYVDETWIGDTVKLIPRLKSWAATYYHADTPVGITEYNWGAEGHMNGATTQADILGIFGREGLDVGVRWTTPDAGTPTYLAIKMYRNYDGQKSTFGDTSVSAVGPNPDVLSSFAAIRTADGALNVMIISKALTGSTPVTLNLAHFAAGSVAHVWRLSAGAIATAPDIALTSGTASFSAPAQSITLLVIPSTGGPTPTATATATVTATARPTATATSRPTVTATSTPRPTATATATSTANPTATSTARPRPTATATATATPTAGSTPTATTAGGTAFYTLTPCRLIDTRNAAGPYGGPALAAGTDRIFALAGQCGIPAGARALSVNVTVTQPQAAGDILLYAADAAAPETAIIPFQSGQTRANNAIVAASADTRVAVRTGVSVHLIVDVNGYFQ